MNIRSEKRGEKKWIKRTFMNNLHTHNAMQCVELKLEIVIILKNVDIYLYMYFIYIFLEGKKYLVT